MSATRQELLERISILDKQINLEASRNRVPRLNLKHRSFPLPTWVLSLCLIGFWVFGGQFMPAFHSKWANYFLLGGALVAVAAIWGTVMWLFTGNQKNDKNYAEAMEKAKVLQDERQALQKQLKQLGG